MDCCNRKNCIASCEIIGLTVSTIIGIIVGYLFAVGLIPITINLITIALFMSVIGLAILIVSLLSANRPGACNAFHECVCRTSKLLLTGSIGTLLATTISAILGVTVVSLVVSVFVGLSAFFFVLMIIAIICLINCIIKELCERDLD